MREILFRGKRLDNGGWIIGDGIHYPKSINYKGTCWIDGGHEKANDWVRVDPSTVEQYTGLTDKNGVKIFEGDIVTIGNGDEPLYVAFIDFSFQLVSKRHKYYKHRPETEETYTVIGNIYENPELLEGVV